MVRHRRHLHNAHHRRHRHRLALMKNKTPQKSQIWKVGTRCFRIVRIEGGQAVVRHHEEFGKFFLNDLRPASAEEIRAYFKK